MSKAGTFCWGMFYTLRKGCNGASDEEVLARLFKEAAIREQEFEKAAWFRTLQRDAKQCSVATGRAAPSTAGTGANRKVRAQCSSGGFRCKAALETMPQAESPNRRHSASAGKGTSSPRVPDPALFQSGGLLESCDPKCRSTLYPVPVRANKCPLHRKGVCPLPAVALRKPTRVSWKGRQPVPGLSSCADSTTGNVRTTRRAKA